MEEPKTNKEYAMYALDGAKMVVVGVGTLAWRGASWCVEKAVSAFSRKEKTGVGEKGEQKSAGEKAAAE